MDFCNTVFVLLEITTGQNLSKIEQYLGEYSPKKPQKGAMSWMLNRYQKFLTSQPHILY